MYSTWQHSGVHVDVIAFVRCPSNTGIDDNPIAQIENTICRRDHVQDVERRLRRSNSKAHVRFDGRPRNTFAEPVRIVQIDVVFPTVPIGYRVRCSCTTGVNSTFPFRRQKRRHDRITLITDRIDARETEKILSDLLSGGSEIR